MRRLTIHLKNQEKVNNKLFNTKSFTVSSEKESNDILSRFGNDVSHSYFTYL